MGKGISQFISMLLIFSISITTISLALSIFKPTIERAYESNSIQEAEMNLKLLNTLIKEVASEGKGSLRSVVIKVSEGKYQLFNSTGNFNGAIVYKIQLKQSFFPNLFFKKIGDLKYSTGISTVGLVGYWNLNEGNGSIVRDLSGYGNDGFIFNGSENCAFPPTPNCPEWVEANYVRGLKLDGENDFVRVEDKNFLFNSSFSVAVVFSYFPKALPENSTMLSKSFNHELNDTFSLFINSTGNLFARVGNGSEFYILSSENLLEEKKFYEAILTFDSQKTQYKLYLNGLEKARFNAPPSWKPAEHKGALLFGTWQEQEWFNGTLDEVRIYGRSLSEDEIKESFYAKSNFQIALEYEKIVLIGKLSVSKGEHKICIEKIGEGYGKAFVKVEAC